MSNVLELERAPLDEVLAVCNEVRKAGGANPLDALLPATPSDPNGCLIARNLNFSCYVQGGSPYDEAAHDATVAAGYFADLDEPPSFDEFLDNGSPSEDQPWIMYVDDDEVRGKIAQALGWALIQVYDDCGDEVTWGLLLPPRIGRVAMAFDRAVAAKPVGSYVTGQKRSYEVAYPNLLA